VGERLYGTLGREDFVIARSPRTEGAGSAATLCPLRQDWISRRGENKVEVLVTNQWVNRLIGDEQLPPENEYGPDRAIKVIPEWYLQGKPKPSGGRITFATWRPFNKESPLLVSGLVGPVRLRTAVRRRVP